MSLQKYTTAREVYMNGLHYYDYDNEDKFGFVSFHNLTQSETIGETDFYSYKLYSDYFTRSPGNYIDDFINRCVHLFERIDIFMQYNISRFNDTHYVQCI